MTPEARIWVDRLDETHIGIFFVGGFASIGVDKSLHGVQTETAPGLNQCTYQQSEMAVVKIASKNEGGRLCEVQQIPLAPDMTPEDLAAFLVDADVAFAHQVSLISPVLLPCIGLSK